MYERDDIDLSLMRKMASGAVFEVRQEALRDAVADVCAYCGGRAYPYKPDRHVLFGPNSAGNYTHWNDELGESLCPAAPIHVRIAYEKSIADKEINNA